MKIISTLYTDYLISQKYKKISPAKYALLLYLASSIRSVSIMFDFHIVGFLNIGLKVDLDNSYTFSCSRIARITFVGKPQPKIISFKNFIR